MHLLLLDRCAVRRQPSAGLGLRPARLQISTVVFSTVSCRSGVMLSPMELWAGTWMPADGARGDAATSANSRKSGQGGAVVDGSCPRRRVGPAERCLAEASQRPITARCQELVPPFTTKARIFSPRSDPQHSLVSAELSQQALEHVSRRRAAICAPQSGSNCPPVSSQPSRRAAPSAPASGRTALQSRASDRAATRHRAAAPKTNTKNTRAGKAAERHAPGQHQNQNKHPGRKKPG